MERTDDSVLVDLAMSNPVESEEVAASVQKVWFDEDQDRILVMIAVKEASDCFQVGKIEDDRRDRYWSDRRDDRRCVQV